jgi:Protein of unknown function (DUF4058)
MPSPFPGMDPYLEAHWRDIHAGLIIYSRDALQGVLPSSLRARVEESVLLETPTGIADHPLIPDVRIVEYPSRRVTETAPGVGIVVAEPELVEVDADPATETFIEIIDRESGNRVVTVIEFLSPSNKSPGRNRDQYERKQREICSSDSNLVEIDLNRFGTHALAFPLGNLKKSGRTPYMASVRRSHGSGVAEVYAMPLWERLRTIKIPLRPTDADVLLDLQPLIDQCYRNGGYEGTLDYAVDPEPPLVGSEKEWAEAMLIEKGLRSKKSPRRKAKPK